MRRLFFSIFCFLIFIFYFSSSPASAEVPEKGFYLGPYIDVAGGAMGLNWDVNQRTGAQEGKNWEPMIHLSFGWNITDWLAPELQTRYGTDRNGSRREHIVGLNAGLNYTLLLKPLLNFEHFRILPFFRPTFAFQIASLPGDPLASDNRLNVIGIGGAIGGGVRFLVNEYLYFGFEIEQEWLKNESKSQLIAGDNILIYRGGWVKQFEGKLLVGVHF